MPSLDAQYDAKLAKAAADKAAAKAKAEQDALDLEWSTKKVGPNGETQAQLDAAQGQIAAADARASATKMATDKAAADAAAADKAAADKAAADKAAADKAAANAAAAAAGGAAGASSSVGTGKNTNAAADLIAKQNADAIAAADKRDRQSAYDTLYNEFNKYGLGSLVAGIKGLIQSNVSPSQFSIELQNTEEYQKRFSANQERIAQGLKALTPAEYIGMEDQYQNIMRNYGLPNSYWSKDTTGKQSGFDKFLANDVSATELENRIATAQQRVVNSNPEVLRALKQFYPDISNGDILSYALDPKNALDNINRKVTAAEIGGAALAQGLQAQGGTAESLAGLGVTKAQAQQGYTDVAGMVPRGSDSLDNAKIEIKYFFG